MYAGRSPPGRVFGYKVPNLGMDMLTMSNLERVQGEGCGK